MDGSGEFFSAFAAALSPEVQPIVVSYPKSEAGYGELAAHARKALPARPHVLVGESFSGPVAIMLAASAPPNLRGVVVVSSFARSPMPLMRWLPFAPPLWRMPEALAARMLLGRFSTPEYRRMLAASLRSIPPAVWRARLRAVRDVDVTALLARLKVPMLYLRASWDRVVPRSASDWLLRHAGDARVVDLEGPHFLLQARPREAAAHVKAFCAAL